MPEAACPGTAWQMSAKKALPFLAAPAHIPEPMQIHASCAARDGHGVLLLGSSGAGKSDLLLRLLDRGWDLVADDRVELDGSVAFPVPELAGLLEIRGLGLVHLPYRGQVDLALAVQLGQGDRMPSPATHSLSGQPLVHIDPRSPSAPERVAVALDCALGRTRQHAGAFARGSSP